MTETFICTVCKNMLPRTAEFFYRFKNNKDGLRTQCKSCHNATRLRDMKKKQKESKEYRREYWLNNKNRLSASFKKYYENNKSVISKTRGRYQKRRLGSDINFNILHKLRCRAYVAIRNQYSKKAKKTIELLGCDFETLRQHIESRFTAGMTWDKILSGEIHIDHIIPCAKFDLSKPGEQAICFGYNNLQPLWAADNLSKRDKIA